jgi:PDZ domain-containing secreted protein
VAHRRDLTNDFDFPIDVTIQLNNVGGPSAGMMFALGSSTRSRRVS